MKTLLLPPSNRIAAGGGSVKVNSDGSITLTPASGQNTVITSGLLGVGANLVPGAVITALRGTGTPRTSGAHGFGIYNSGNDADGRNWFFEVPLTGSGSLNISQYPDSGSGRARIRVIPTATFTGNPDVDIQADGTVILLAGLQLGGNLVATTDNSVDIGASGATRPRTGYFGTSIVAPTITQSGANGKSLDIKQLTELTTIAAAASTDTAIQIPANAVVFAVSVRVTVVIPTAATFTVTGTTSGTTFNTTAVSAAANSTDAGTAACPYKNGAAQTIRITPNLTPADTTGRVRVTIHYYEITPPTS